ncbi:hypothetical protein F5X68DRAFT_238822 [Plectosphaerella plurivora]|uniref:Dyp-type peroxidase n=1 Tax=Plectosphaerella plurivora TaxID=936078 RepID=A0A9P8VLF0_9PEZI|nr:hypothetical protein F5X68DRAFT_238822 [Plectosphaerella plurivora]
MGSMTPSQAVGGPLTRCATFLTFRAKTDRPALTTIRSTVASVQGLTKNVAIRDRQSNLTCTVAIGSTFWDRLTEVPRPRELHSLPIIKGRVHSTVSTPGDIFFHIKSDSRDLSFELERQVVAQLDNSVELSDSTVGFKYFDARDLLGFVDGTANPVGNTDVATSTMVTQEDDPAAAGGSYVVVQKYLHDMSAWKALSVEQQESVVGRTKLDNMELDDAPEGKQAAHKTLATVTDSKGEEHDIFRENMPFGSPAAGEFGTYFIGYSSKLWVVEKMLERMFVGVPSGMHDRILDYSRPVTGCTFFAPSTEFLEGLGDLG